MRRKGRTLRHLRREEALWLGRNGLTHQQGFYYARPSLASLVSGLEPKLHDLQQAL